MRVFPLSRRHRWQLTAVAVVLGAAALLGFNLTKKSVAPRTLSAAANGTDGAFTPPGADEVDSATRAALLDRWENRDPDYLPRTAHLHPGGSPHFINRLFLETSPYLLQHAHNPVNWYSWGDEAFETARRLGRPVLLSIGYSTCHWCHVMEEESFEDLEIARYMNENYIAIKVDREERPDVDAIYMSAVQAMTGRGGWPMTVWLTPDRKPFYGGTYFPARDGDRGVRLGFFSMLKSVRHTYDTKPDDILNQANRLTEAVRTNLAGPRAGSDLPDESVLHKAFDQYKGSFDETFGGSGSAPKFPSSLPVRFLLRYHRRTGDDAALHMAAFSLEKMARGGMHDQVGGGFHRYSVDRQWLVPHFEKMLYDNALLTLAYLEAYQVTGRADFREVAENILQYVARDMTDPDGAFYSATDADSPTPEGHREEGWFFTWTPEELDQALGADHSKAVQAYYGVSSRGNFEGRSILHAPRPYTDVAAKLKTTPDELRKIVQESRAILYEIRGHRPPPLRDEKILTAWNGLMISAFARACLVLGDPLYAERATAAADFVLTQMWRDGLLSRSYKDGQTRHQGVLDDYAFLIQGLLDLYEATGQLRWLSVATKLDNVLADHFEDSAGGFFFTGTEHEALLAREKPTYDGAVPTGNSIHALNLFRLQEFTTNDRYRQRAEGTLRAMSSILGSQPRAMSEMLVAVDWLLDEPKEILIVTPRTRIDASAFLAQLGSTFLPNRIIGIVREDETEQHAALLPLVEAKVAMDGNPTAYVCIRGLCELPTVDPIVFGRQIARVVALRKDGRP